MGDYLSQTLITGLDGVPIKPVHQVIQLGVVLFMIEIRIVFR